MGQAAPSIYISLLPTEEGYAKRIQARLVERFGMDVLRWVGGSPSRAAVENSSIVLALISRNWKPDKFVTEELSRAFKIKLPVIPVLIEGASMPTKSLTCGRTLPCSSMIRNRSPGKFRSRAASVVHRVNHRLWTNPRAVQLQRNKATGKKLNERHRELWTLYPQGLDAQRSFASRIDLKKR